MMTRRKPIYRRGKIVTYAVLAIIASHCFMLCYLLIFYPSAFLVSPMQRHSVDVTIDSCQEFQTMHIVFSTGCSLSQNWQAYVFFYHAMRVGQQGDITRIISGCTDREQQLYARRHQEEVVDKMSSRFHIHFTPDYSDVIESVSYKYFNKPFGLRHWMEKSLEYPHQHKKHDDTIIALLDPDMVLTRPLVNNFAGSPTNLWYIPGQLLGLADVCASHGRPIAQQYDYKDHWLYSVGDHLVDVVGKDSPVHKVTADDALIVYAPGPPCLLTARDMYLVVAKWCEFTPKIYHFFPYLLAEMFGYAMASAHLQLRYQLGYNMMISEPLREHEGWTFLDGVEPRKVCATENVRSLPLILHYCQEYSVGMHFVSKYRVDDNFVSCEAPLLPKPPADLALQSKHWLHSNGSTIAFKDLRQVMRVSFVLCLLTDSLNQAASHFKQNHCVSPTM